MSNVMQVLTKANPKLLTALCVGFAFVPLLITAVYIYLDIELSSWSMLFNPINFAAFLWVGMTYLHYRHTKTKGAAWIFALFPVAFAEPFLLLSLYVSVKYLSK
jgi:hypothetical protein